VTLLLLLSALLSALTGGADMAGRVAAPQTVSRDAAVHVATPASARATVLRPANRPATLADIALLAGEVRFAVPPAAPLFAARRRE
jgi:hypothetical protein